MVLGVLERGDQPAPVRPNGDHRLHLGVARGAMLFALPGGMVAEARVKVREAEVLLDVLP